jgi:quinol monooxygenase YgiN
MVTVALLVRVEAKPGKEAEVEEFLTNAQPIVMGEPDTVVWFAVKFGPSSFGIFDAFPNDAGRQSHLTGQVGTALMKRADELFSQPPSVEQIDVLATKLA